ncbi:hypothetical protein EHF33_16280 (plasmid) [Deinococcus psychrotolerans]|uniref:Porin domain-containing protein n=1 Tax=Deinococcus psychrotolerans TaxID=2489213 RepID=A0A3G8YGP5_9DEIO|nr:hypothetical protein [Deinococcus psychrotolerans]AZI44472.1 hypothetical protein EHF33_16280 [Deinococcus psychrotolerans]
MKRAKSGRAGALSLLLCSFASAANTSGDYVQFRYFYPSSGLEGGTLDGQYSYRAAAFSVSLRASELSLQRQNANLSLSSGGYFGYASVSREAERQTATYTALAGYSSPNPGLFSDATLTYVRAEDGRPDQGYVLNSVSLDTRGQFSKAWRWSAGGSWDNTKLNLTPDDPGTNRSLNLGLTGKVASVDIRARAKLSSSDTGSAPNALKWSANLDAGVPITSTERLAAALSYNSQQQDSESLTLSSARFTPLSLSAALTRTRADSLFGARLNADYTFSEALSVSGEYGLSFASPLSQDGSLSLDYRSGVWTLGAGLAADSTPDVNNVPTYSVSPRLNVGYAGTAFTASVRGNARYAPAQKDPWSYHVDANAQTLGSALTFALNLAADSPSTSRPLTAQIGLQALYALSDHWTLNVSARSRLGTAQPSIQGGLGVRYVF